jgi:hypothetical protein
MEKSTLDLGLAMVAVHTQASVMVTTTFGFDFYDFQVRPKLDFSD